MSVPFNEPSPEGVPAPEPPAGVSDAEAFTPARRSPEVREAQRIGSRRPDLLPRARSDR